MSKILLINDTHAGARSDSQVFDGHFRNFFSDQFFPFLDSHKEIKTIVHLGDVFDRRKFINFQTLNSVREYFLDELNKRGLELVVLVGNHDSFYKNTLSVNSIDLLVANYPNVTVIEEPTEMKIGDVKVLLLPWICDDNAEKTAEMVEQTTATVCFGHLEIGGFAMYRGMVNTDGLDPHMFDKFKLTCSGHFHHKNSDGTIHYLGSPYEMTWSDADDPRGFHVLDTRTLKLTFVKNDRRIFYKIFYNEKNIISVPPARMVKGSCFKIIVEHKDDFAKFDRFVDELNRQGAAEIRIIEDLSDFEALDLDEDIEVEDTKTLLEAYIDATDTELDKDRIKALMTSLFIEAQSMDGL